MVLIVAAMASFLASFMAASINIALPTIGRKFSAGAITLSWVTTACLLAGAVHSGLPAASAVKSRTKA